jgi:hypothetical protein
VLGQLNTFKECRLKRFLTFQGSGNIILEKIQVFSDWVIGNSLLGAQGKKDEKIN